MDGLVLSSSADGSTIRGLVIRDWSASGIWIHPGSDNNLITGNYIGQLTTGGTDSGYGTGNDREGIYLEGANNTIGGTSAAARNVISGNADGIFVIGAGAANNVIQGNTIGATAAGNVALGNQSENITIDGAVNTKIGGAVAWRG